MKKGKGRNRGGEKGGEGVEKRNKSSCHSDLDKQFLAQSILRFCRHSEEIESL